VSVSGASGVPLGALCGASGSRLMLRRALCSVRVQVLLVDQSDRFVFKPLLYELLTKGVTCDLWLVTCGSVFFRNVTK